MHVAGGEALQVTTTAATRAAEEAATGKWLEELESGRPLKALAPGMDQGVFGAWELSDEATGVLLGTSTFERYSPSTENHCLGMSKRDILPCAQVLQLFLCPKRRSELELRRRSRSARMELLERTRL